MNTLLDIARSFEARGGRTAMVYRTGVRRFVFSYGDLYAFSRKTAAWLELQGVGKGDRVLLWGPNSPWWVAAFWGTVMRGAVVVPVDFMSKRERAETIAGLTESKLIFQSDFKIDRFKGDNAHALEELEYALEAVGDAFPAPVVSSEPGDVAEIVYTSGTTGNPKGVVLSHKNLAANVLQIQKHFPFVTGEFRFLSLLPLSHLFEQTVGMLVPFSRGAGVVYMRTLKPSAIMDAFARERIYTAVIVPRLLFSLKVSVERELEAKHLLGLFEKARQWFESAPRGLKKAVFYPIHRKFGSRFLLFVSGGAPLNEETARFWNKVGFTVLEGYGLTECSPVLTANEFRKEIVGSVGKPLPGVEIKVENYEVLARGENVFQGYYQNKEATAAAFMKAGWFKTGDLGTLDARGNLFIRGRRKEMIVTAAGVNVFPEDIERVLDAVEGVRESCVIGIDKGAGEEVHAVLLLEEGAEPEKVIRAANDKLDTVQHVTGFTVWRGGEFPKTTTLKLKRFQVKESVAWGGAAEKDASADVLVRLVSTATEAPLAKIREDASLVADLGLTSIARLELVTYIEQEFHVDFEDTLITPQTTVGDLRTLVAGRKRHKVKDHLRLWTDALWVVAIRKVVDTLFHYPVFRFFLEEWRIEGLESVETAMRKTPVIFIANHVSYGDHGALYYALPPAYRYRVATAAREEFFFPDRASFAQKTLKRFAYECASILFNVFLLPQKGAFRRTLEHMGRLVDRGESILLFPEGERSRDGKLLPFQPGLGVMARELKVPVVPVKIAGMENVFPRGAPFPKRGMVKITFGKPLTFGRETPDEIREKARRALEELK